MSVNEELQRLRVTFDTLMAYDTRRDNLLFGLIATDSRDEGMVPKNHVVEAPIAVTDSTNDLVDMNEIDTDPSIGSDQVIEVAEDQFDVEVAEGLPTNLAQSINALHNKDPIDDEDFLDDLAIVEDTIDMKMHDTYPIQAILPINVALPNYD